MKKVGPKSRWFRLGAPIKGMTHMGGARQTFRQPLVGERLRELRERAGLSRAALARAVGINASALARLEKGDDVRLSTYLSVIDYFLARSPQAWMIADQIVALDDERRAKFRDLMRWFGGGETSGGEHA
jgi:DNA-binding XRE family transcriptional regulator